MLLPRSKQGDPISDVNRSHAQLGSRGNGEYAYNQAKARFIRFIERKIMVFTNKYTEILMQKFPNFANSLELKDAVDLFSDGSENVNAYTVFSGLTNYVVYKLIKENNKITQEEIALYNFIEEMLLKYYGYPKPSPEYDVDNAACTCFLENLLNRASAGRIEYARFIPYLGEKSKEYCRAWDEFTGVKSPGLW